MAGAGSLDKRIRFERKTPTRDEMGGVGNLAWSPLGTVWASRLDASDGEKFAADQTIATRLCRFVVRSSTMTRGVTPKDRLMVKEQPFEILGTKETRDGRDRYIEVTAVERVDEEGLGD